MTPNGADQHPAARRVHSLAELMKALDLQDERTGETGGTKRAHGRQTLSAFVTVRVIKETGPGPPLTYPALTYAVWDVSAAGMCITSHFRFDEGERVLADLRIDDTAWTGQLVVRHCTQTVGGYKVGLEQAEPAPNSSSPPSGPTAPA